MMMNGKPKMKYPASRNFFHRSQEICLTWIDLTIAFYVDEDINIANLGVLDEYLAGDNFSRVNRMTIALYPSPLTQTWSGLRNICKKIRQQFPLLDKHGTLTVNEVKLNYPNYTIGID